MLRASKKLCVRGGVLSWMSAAGGAATNAVAGAATAGAMDEVPAGATYRDPEDDGSAGFISTVAGATAVLVGAVSVVAGASAGTNFISVGLISVAAGAMSVPEIGGVTATRAFEVGAADAVAEDVFAEE